MAKSSANSRKRLGQADSSKRNGYTEHPAKSRPARPVDLRRAVEGDPSAFALISSLPQETIRQLRAAHGNLMLTRDAVRAVLEDLQSGRITPEQAQRWASFVRRGYVAGSQSGPVHPIDIEYDADDEEAIAEVLARLDEIGDLVDGTLDADEIGEMIGRLSSTHGLANAARRA